MASMHEFDTAMKTILRLINELPEADRLVGHEIWQRGGCQALGRWASIKREIEETIGDEGAAAHALDLLTACDNFDDIIRKETGK